MLRTALLFSILAVGAGDRFRSSEPPRAACSVLALDDVRAIVAAPVDIFAAGSAAPTTTGETTISNCTYVTAAKNGRGARVSLMWAPSAKLGEANAYYVKRNKELTAVRGAVLVIASVTEGSATGMTYDRPASEKLLAAVLRKLAP